VFICLGQLLAQFECTALLSCPLYMHMYMFLCFVHGQIKWWWWWCSLLRIQEFTLCHFCNIHHKYTIQSNLFKSGN